MIIVILETFRERIPFSSHAVTVLMSAALTMLLASSANAALREYRVEFAPSASASAVGYLMFVGTSSGNYDAQFNLGSPPTSGASVVYAVDLEDSRDLFIALRSYSETGVKSDYSNEISVAAIVIEPPPPPTPGDGDGSGSGTGGGDGDGSGSDGGTGGDGSDPDPAPVGSIIEGARLGIGTASDGLISALLSDGSFDSITMDSLAATGKVRPARCDLDGDADLDIVMGFGLDSGGQVALIFLEDGGVSSVTSIAAGPDKYRQKSGQTVVACGDLDGDGRSELVVGFDFRMRGVVQIFDDVQTGFRPFDAVSTDELGYMRLPVPDNFWGGTYPAIGDIDGDGRGELVIGLGWTVGGGRLLVLDDFLSDFGVHPANQTGNPWIEINPGDVVETRRTLTLPALGDLDGDGRDEIVVGFGMGSGAVVVVLDDVVDGFPITPVNALRIATGRARYVTADGATRISVGNVDGDVSDELVVSFERSGNHEVQVFDDMSTGMAPMTVDSGFVVSAADPSLNGIVALPMN